MHIKNGSLMDEEWIKNYAWLYETIGFSVDSINDETNRKIGRCDRNGKTIPSGRVVELCGLIRKYAPGCRIKINTVVSALNKDEIMSDFIDEIAADRWKILRMKPFQYGSFSNLDIQVSDEEFELLLYDKFVILKLVIVICLRRIIVEKERKI